DAEAVSSAERHVGSVIAWLTSLEAHNGWLRLALAAFSAGGVRALRESHVLGTAVKPSLAAACSPSWRTRSPRRGSHTAPAIAGVLLGEVERCVWRSRGLVLARAPSEGQKRSTHS